MLSFKQCCHSSAQVNPLREHVELQEMEITLFLNDNIHTGALIYLSSLLEPSDLNFSESFHLEPPSRTYRKALRTIVSIIELWKRA